MIDNLMFLLVLQSPAADPTWARIRDVAAAYPDTAAARAAGFAPLARGDIQDLSPFQGQHWLRLDRVLRHDSEVDAPSFVMFVPVGGVMKPVGVAYSVRIGHEESPPAELDGSRAPWHLHQLCFQIPGEGRALAEGVDDCRARGGTPTPRQLAMVHAWTGANNPEGSYAHDNLALPYVAVGLTPPSAADLPEPAAWRRARALGLALGETYGARLPYARRIELVNRDASLRDSLELHRTALRRLSRGLVAAERSSDSTHWSGLASKAISEWDRLALLYERMAPTPEVRAQFRRQRDAALGGGHHHD